MSGIKPGAWRDLPERTPKLCDLPDDELMLAYIVHDDNTAFGELYRRLYPTLLRYAERRVRPREFAHDLVQQAFLNAHLARDRFLLGSPARPWLTRILVNLVRDHLRANRARPRADIDVHELPEVEHAPLPERNEAVRITRRALLELTPVQRQVITLHWIEERSFPEVAKALGEQVSTVKVRAHRAYKELRRALEPNDAPLVSTARKC